MNNPMKITQETLDTWATDPSGPVALYLKQRLAPVEEGGVIFPPTYADIGYNIDTLSDGTKVATVDNVGSQANRMEPIFESAPYRSLVPQLKIIINENNGHKEMRSIFALAHRSGDAVVQSCPTLAPKVAATFEALKHGDAGPLCALAPTSLVFGVWDSRGSSNEKRPRLVRSIIRAWDVQPLHAAAQFNSVWKALDESQQDTLKKESEAKKTKLSEIGFADAPAVFRKTKIPQLRNGEINPEARVLGGVLLNGRVEREVIINLIALRGLSGADTQESNHIRKYLLGLSLIAATADIDLYLREGCFLRYAGEDAWFSVPRRGNPDAIDVSSDDAKAVIRDYATSSAEHFKTRWPKENELEHVFDLKEAKKLLAKKDEEESAQE